MNPIPQMESVSSLRNNYNALIDRLADGPIVLSQHAKGTAVLVSIAQWNMIAKRLKVLEGLLEAKANASKADADPASMVSLAEVKQRIAAKADAHVGN